MYKRTLQIKNPKKSFFLWGQRQTGKSSLLKSELPHAMYIDLLQTDEFLLFASNPSILRERVGHLSNQKVVVLDEIQKVPLLLNEVHSLIESKKIIFALCGSSARKLKRGHGNLLGGRALQFELLGLSAYELKNDFDLVKLLNRGYLPSHYQDEDFFLSLQSYVGNYLKEEILAEGLSRSLPVFSRFLEVAAIGDTDSLNYSNIARETGVSLKTVQAYYEILIDTLTGIVLPAYTKRMKRRTLFREKFYFHDVGIVNFLCRRRQIEPKSETFGKAFENWIHHELRCFISYSKSSYPLWYWRLTNGAEVDFILGDMETAIEAKATSRVTNDHLKHLRSLKNDFSSVKTRMIVCLEKNIRKTEDGIWIIPYQVFIQALWSNSLTSDVVIKWSF